MVRNLAFFRRCASAVDDILEWPIIHRPAQPARLELPQAIANLHSRQHGLAEDAPRLIAATRKTTDAGELFLSVLGPATASKSADNTDKLAAELQPTVNHRVEYELG